MRLLVKKIFYVFLSLVVGVGFLLSSQNCSDCKTGDLNLDGKVNILDLHLLQHFLLQKNSFAVIGDQNGDNKVDVIDLQILFNRLEKKWQEKRTGLPVYSYINSTSIPVNILKGVITHSYANFNRGTEFTTSPSAKFLLERRDDKIKTEPYLLTGFLSHAPPIC